MPDALQGLDCQLYSLVSYASVLYPDNSHLRYIPDFDSYAKAIAEAYENDSEDFRNMPAYLFDILRDSYHKTAESDNSFEAILHLFTNLESRHANFNNMFNDLYFGDSPGQ